MLNCFQRKKNSDDTVLIIAEPNKKLQPPVDHPPVNQSPVSQSPENQQRRPSNVAESTECLPVNLCGRHFNKQNHFFSTPTLLAGINKGYNNPWEKIREKLENRGNCKSATDRIRPPDSCRKKNINNKSRNINQCRAKPKKAAFKCCIPKKTAKPLMKISDRVAFGTCLPCRELPPEYQVYFNKMMNKFKTFCCKQAMPPRATKTAKPFRRSRLHRVCGNEHKTVPNHMGWNWMINRKERSAGWRPGAIPKTVRQLMYHFLDPYPCDTNPVSKQNRKPLDLESLPDKPIFQLRRHNDDYTVTMNALDDDHRPKSPVFVTISASAEQKQFAKIKEILLFNGFRYCCCGRSLARCECRNPQQLKELYCFIEQIERKYQMKNIAQRFRFEESKDLFLEFTPANIVESMSYIGPNERVQVIRCTPSNGQVAKNQSQNQNQSHNKIKIKNKNVNLNEMKDDVEISEMGRKVDDQTNSYRMMQSGDHPTTPLSHYSQNQGINTELSSESQFGCCGLMRRKGNTLKSPAPQIRQDETQKVYYPNNESYRSGLNNGNRSTAGNPPNSKNSMVPSIEPYQQQKCSRNTMPEYRDEIRQQNRNNKKDSIDQSIGVGIVRESRGSSIEYTKGSRKIANTNGPVKSHRPKRSSSDSHIFQNEIEMNNVSYTGSVKSSVMHKATKQVAIMSGHKTKPKRRGKRKSHSETQYDAEDYKYLEERYRRNMDDRLREMGLKGSKDDVKVEIDQNRKSIKRGRKRKNRNKNEKGLGPKPSVIRCIHVGQRTPNICCGDPCHNHNACQEYCPGVDVCQRGLQCSGYCQTCAYNWW